jgi:hypothetical protein
VFFDIRADVKVSAIGNSKWIPSSCTDPTQVTSRATEFGPSRERLGTTLEKVCVTAFYALLRGRGVGLSQKPPASDFFPLSSILVLMGEEEILGLCRSGFGEGGSGQSDSEPVKVVTMKSRACKWLMVNGVKPSQGKSR